MRILIAEDDAELADGLTGVLRQTGHAVDWVGDGRAADCALRGTPFDLLILDLGLPKLDGLEVLRRLRAQRSETMVLILSARDELEARIRGLDLGADDYLVKPFAVSELEARIRALARRRSGFRGAEARCGSLILDGAGQGISFDGRLLDLTRAEFVVLGALIECCGKVVSKAQLFEKLYDWNAEVNLAAVEVFVSRCRRKTESSGMRIRSIRGLGYLLERDRALGRNADDGE